jgi:tetratricopeptide (TPR) repeat protein
MFLPAPTRRGTLRLLGIVAVALGSAGVGRADPPRPISRDEAFALCEQGLDAAKVERNFEKARELYGRALPVLPDVPAVLFNLALSDFLACHPGDAIAHFDQYVARPDADPAKVEKIRKEIRVKAVEQAKHGCANR